MVHKYTTHLSSLGRGVTQWRTTALVLGTLSIVLAVGMARTAGQHETLLIPMSVARSSNLVHVRNSGVGSPQYLRLLAEADLSTLLDWQPLTVVNQINGFLARLAPHAYASYSLRLTGAAQKYRKSNLSEEFYLHSMTYIPPGVMKVKGTLVRWAGATKVLKTRVTYVLTYTSTGQGLSIASLEVSK